MEFHNIHLKKMVFLTFYADDLQIRITAVLHTLELTTVSTHRFVFCRSKCSYSSFNTQTGTQHTNVSFTLLVSCPF